MHRGRGSADRGSGLHERAEQDLAGQVDDADLDDLAEQVGGLGVQDDGVLETEPGAGPAAQLEGSELSTDAAGDLHTEGRFLGGAAVTGGGRDGWFPFSSSTSRCRRGRLVGPTLGWLLLRVPSGTDTLGSSSRTAGECTFPGSTEPQRSSTATPGTPCRVWQ